MKWIGLGLGVVVVLLIVVAAIGATLPRNHVASRTIRLQRPPSDVWPVLNRLASESDVPVDVLESTPPSKLVTRVKATETMFGGTWTTTIAADGPGSTVTISEDGWVANPIFRFVSRYVIGHHATMDGLLTNVAKAFGEPAQLSGE